MLDGLEGLCGPASAVAVSLEAATDFAGIDVAHQPADVLTMPAQRFSAGHLLPLEQCLQQILAQWQRPQSLGFQTE